MPTKETAGAANRAIGRTAPLRRESIWVWQPDHMTIPTRINLLILATIIELNKLNGGMALIIAVMTISNSTVNRKKTNRPTKASGRWAQSCRPWRSQRQPWAGATG